MAAAVAAPAGAASLGAPPVSLALAAKAEDVRRLQSQVDQLRERLDYVSSMIPLVNLSQDYFQKVECEASVHLRRLAQQQVPRDSEFDEDVDGEHANQQQLETAKWLHFITDAVISLHSSTPSRRLGSPGESSVIVGRGGVMDIPDDLRHLRSEQPDSTAAGYAPSPRACNDSSLRVPQGAASGASFGGGSVPTLSGTSEGGSNVYGGGAFSATFGGSSTASGGQPLWRRPAPASRQDSGVSTSAPTEASPAIASRGNFLLSKPATGLDAARHGRPTQTSSPVQTTFEPQGGALAARSAAAAAQAQAQAAAAATAAYMSGRGIAAPHGIALAQPFGAEENFADLSRRPTEEPLAEPGTGGTAGMTLGEGPDGLMLGRGSWATAYHNAHGPRRDALRLLCSSGIVTARELGDDNTVISEEHIDECVLIATEMLQTWPMEMWAKQPQEAKKFFEARLTALYQRKFGEQKG